jgi:hypothetical protein
MTPDIALSENEKSMFLESPAKLVHEMAMTKYKGDLIRKGFMSLQINVT